MPRRAALIRELRRLLPRIPGWEAEEVVGHVLASRSMRSLPPAAAVKLAAVAFVRHTLTDYEDLLAQGWGVEAARHAVAPVIDAVLAEWRA